MRERILNKLDESLGNGKVKVLLGAYSDTMENFVNDQLKDHFKSAYIIGPAFGKINVFEHLKENIDSNEKRIFILKRIPDHEDIDAIINLFDGNKNADLIATSNERIEDALGKKATSIRGRVQYLMFPPFLYDDFFNNKYEFDLFRFIEDVDNRIFDYIFDYKYKDEIQTICNYISRNVGFPMNFRGLFSAIKSNVSLNTFVSIFNYSVHHGFFYTLKKFDLKKMDELPNYMYCYPTDIPSICQLDISIERKRTNIYESCVVAKLINEKCLVYKAVYRNSENEYENALTNTYIVFSKSKTYLLKMYLKENEQSLNKFLNYKSLYPRYVLVMDKIDTYLDKEHGVLFESVETFLSMGV